MASASAPGGVEDHFHPSISVFGACREADLPAVDGRDLRRMWGDPRSLHPNGQQETTATSLFVSTQEFDNVLK